MLRDNPNPCIDWPPRDRIHKGTGCAAPLVAPDPHQTPMIAPMLRHAPAFFLALVLLPLPAVANEFCDKELGPMMQQTKTLTGQLAAISKRSKAPNAREQFCGTLNA